MTVIVFIWIGTPIDSQFGSTGLYRAEVLTAGIMNSGMSGLIMRRKFSILNWWNGLREIIVKFTLFVFQID